MSENPWWLGKQALCVQCGTSFEVKPETPVMPKKGWITMSQYIDRALIQCPGCRKIVQMDKPE